MSDDVRTPGAVPIVVGAYAATGPNLDAHDEGRVIDGILETKGVRGLEVPMSEAIHVRGDEWLLSHLRPTSTLVLTLITDAVARLRIDPSFGLASTSREGRAAALFVARRTNQAVERLTELKGLGAVTAVEVHSAPAVTSGSSWRAFRDSLQEIAAWDWHGAELLVEHCDQRRIDQPFAKGFLGLEEEISAIEGISSVASTRVGVAINWGRSAIEGRSIRTPTEHVRLADSAGLLRTIVFSGCSDRADSRGGEWADVHLPPTEGPHGEPASLMTGEAMGSTLAQIADPSTLAYIGVKISCPPEAEAPRRLSVVRNAIDQVRAAIPHFQYTR